MSESDTSSASAPRPVRRTGRSINVILQVVLFIVVVIAANYLSCARHQRYDLTQRHDFSLSDTSEQFLQSDALQKREAPLRIIAVIRRTSPHFTRVFNLLEEYKRIGGDGIELEVIDPIRQTDRTLEIENTYKQPYVEDMIIVDGRSEKADDPNQARTDQPPKTLKAVEGSKSPQTKPKDTPLQKFTAHVRMQRISDLYLKDDRGNISAWQDEDIITSSIIGAIEGKPRRIYFAADKVNLEANEGDPAWQNLANLLWQQNILLTPLRLAETKSIPEDAEGFALIGPQYDLNNQEIKILSDYWDRQQSSLFITLDPKASLPNLRVFLRSYGVTPRNDRIMTDKDGQILSNVHAVFSRGTEITQALGGKSTIFEGSTCSLEVRENDDALINRRIRPLSLIQAVDGWWGETRFQTDDIKFNKEEDSTTPLHLAAAILRGKATSDDTANLVSKMVVISNSDFLATKKTRPEQADFVKSSVNWLVGREDLIGIGPRKLHRHKITLLDAHDTFISRVILIFLPLASLLTAMIVWNMRRA